ncbi:hypothetical protein NKI56_36270 [Mesorhizobium sp. M0622]
MLAMLRGNGVALSLTVVAAARPFWIATISGPDDDDIEIECDALGSSSPD